MLFFCSYSCRPLNLVFQLVIILHDLTYSLMSVINIFEEFYPYESYNHAVGRFEPCVKACKVFDISYGALLFVNCIIETSLTVYYFKIPKRPCCISFDRKDVESSLESGTTQQVTGYTFIFLNFLYIHKVTK